MLESLHLRMPRIPIFLAACCSYLLLAGSIWAATPAPAPPDPAPRASQFKLHITETGAYRLHFDELTQTPAAAAIQPVDTQLVTLTVGGQPVPVRLNDGGDGIWGPGDSIDFVGRALPGEHSFYNEFADHNVYRLSLTGQVAPASQAAPAAETSAAGSVPVVSVDGQAADNTIPAQAPLARNPLRVETHLEEDRLLLRFPKRRKEKTPELWYWQKLTHLHQPFLQRLDLWTYAGSQQDPISITISLRGWSHPSRRRQAEEEVPPDHLVEVLLNGTVIGSGEWNAQEEHRIKIDAVPHDLVRRGNRLEIRVPRRTDPGTQEPLIDVVMLNWIKLAYPRSPWLNEEQAHLAVADHGAGAPLRLLTRGEETVSFFDRHGHAFDDSAVGHWQRDGTYIWQLESPPAGELFAVPESRFKTVDVIQLDHASDLRKAQQADYVMIVHPHLRSALQPLAQFHRQNGRQVAVVDIHDVYDEFNHGVQHPRAIRDFLRYTAQSWFEPRPRFVLLVGDASWDTKNDDVDDQRYADWTYRPGEAHRFVKNGSVPYQQESDLGHRNLIPTWPYQSHQGHAASDNYFADIDGDDGRPELAIGRLPIVEPEELTAIVDKILRYASSNDVGPWRRQVLWITNEMKAFQRRSDVLAADLSARGFANSRVYPHPEEQNNEQHQTSLTRAFDDGQLLVHFLGHGGRYIWRTGPPDYRKNHDLFTLDDLDKLQPADGRLPLVLSMSCYSAPFDHPTADSIGEKFLRLADRGAIAVLAASWRNSPSMSFSRDLVEHLMTPGLSMGEAIRLAKQPTSETLAQMYNLLGDPAIELARPQLEVDVALEGSPAAAMVAKIDLAKVSANKISAQDFSGQALFEWLDEAGQSLKSQQVPMKGSQLRVELPAEPAAHSLQVYIWDESQGIDGLGAVPLNPEPTEASASAAAASPRP